MSTVSVKRDRELLWIPVDRIIKNERNPRMNGSFSEPQLATLRESIKQHGVINPVIVQKYDDDMFLLIEGERRWTSAKIDGIKELPAIVINRIDEHEQVMVMYNLHTQRKGWEMLEELNAIRKLKETNGHLSDAEMAKRLAISLATYRDRLRVLNMDPQVHVDIASGTLDYSSALRSAQAATALAKNRPELTEKLGGAKEIEKRFIRKAKARGGISQELVGAKVDLTDVDNVDDDVIEDYLSNTEASLRDVRRNAGTLAERRKVEDLYKDLRRLERTIRTFGVDLSAAPNLRQLRNALASLIEASTGLEGRVVEAMHKKSDR